MVKRTVKWLVLCVLLIVFVICFTVYLAIDAQPKVNQNFQLNSTSAQKSKQLLKRTVSVLKQHKDASQIVMSQEELNGLSALLHRAIPEVSSEITLSKEHMNLAFSLHLPVVNRYLNVETQILPSEKSLELAELHIGDLFFSGKFTLSLTRWLLNHYVQPDLGNSLLATVRQVTLNSDYSVFTLLLPDNLLNANKDDSLLFKLRDEFTLFGDPHIIRTYYQELVRISVNAPTRSSLAYYFRYIFRFAQQRSLAFEHDQTVNENKAALLALALYFGTDKFELLVGDISQLDINSQTLRRKLQRQTLLQGRVDLQKHFIYSVALQIFSSVHASDAIGEFKEFLDSNKGGSGFSFVDLMADRAGTRLAELATFSPESALEIQNLLAQITDDTLLPNIKGLPEGLSSQRFEAKYKAIHTQEYQLLLNSIDQRLSQLALYKLLNE